MPKSKVRKKRKNRSPAPPPKADPAKHKESPVWYVALMFGLMAIGMIVIILNYMGLTPGETSNFWLITGLAGIAVGFGMTLNYH